MKDYIIEEIRNIRKEIEKDCKNQGISFEEYLMEIQKQFKDKLINFEKKEKLDDIQLPILS